MAGIAGGVLGAGKIYVRRKNMTDLEAVFIIGGALLVLGFIGAGIYALFMMLRQAVRRDKEIEEFNKRFKG